MIPLQLHTGADPTPVPPTPEPIQPDPAPRPECIGRLGTMCVGDNLHQMVSGGVAGNLIEENNPRCMGLCEGIGLDGYPKGEGYVVPPPKAKAKAKPVVSKEEAAAVVGLGALIAALLG